MKRNEIIYTDTELVTFRIGIFTCGLYKRHLNFERTGRSIFFDQDNYIFEKYRDNKGKFCKKYLTDSDGNTLMDSFEYSEALLTGCGTLDFDGVYNTIYTKFLSECDDNEIHVIINSESWDKDYLIEYFIKNKMVDDNFIRNYLYNKNN